MALAGLVRVAGGGRQAALRAAITGMPVAGFSGTLAPGQSVFGNFGRAALGTVQAKTGNLTRVVSLAGIVSDASGRLLAFAFMADRLPGGQLVHAAGVIDAMATALAGCGCRWRSSGRGAALAARPAPATLPADAAAPRNGPPPGRLPAGSKARRDTSYRVSTYGGGVNSGQMIDWDVAISTGVRWVRPGPQVSLADARAVVAELRELAVAVAEPVHEVTGMISAEDAGRVAVVDRAGWIRANVDGFRVVLDPLADHLREQGRAPDPGSMIASVGSRVTGMQAGLILAYLAGRVLGQYELFLPPDPETPESAAPAGRLTLVAPNILMVERELGVDPHDFRRWVCLHEETHRTQFTSVEWLRGYVQDQMTQFLLASDLDPATILDRVRAAADAMAGAVRGGDGDSLIEAIQTPRQREILDRLTCVMTLVEGHGDYVMDAVGPKVVPSVAEIRAAFNARRGSAWLEQTIRRMLGIELKMKQYAQGSRFVATVVAEAGMDTFNRVWTSPETLPTKDEITAPALWLERVGGNGAKALEG